MGGSALEYLSEPTKNEKCLRQLKSFRQKISKQNFPKWNTAPHRPGLVDFVPFQDKSSWLERKERDICNDGWDGPGDGFRIVA